MEIFKLFGSILIKDEDALKKLDDIDKKGEKTGKSLSQMSKDIGEGMKTTGKVFLGVGASITGAMAGLVKTGAEWSAEVAGQQFLYNNLDKSIQKSIDSNSKNARSIGLTTQQYKNSATTISTYYKNMGLTSEQTAKLGGETMNLVADLGAVVDMPFDEAMSRFKSGLMGNYEALDAFGINLSANTLANSEYVKSLGKSWNQLSDNEKMMAAYNEILRQAVPMKGLAAQEAGSFGMQMKLLWQTVKETAGSIGEKLLPVLQPLIEKFLGVIEKVSAWVQENPKLTQTILIIVGAFGIFSMALGALLIPIGGIIVAVSTFNVAMLPTYGIVLGIVAVIAILIAVGVALVVNWNSIKEKASEIWNNISTAISNFVSQCVEWVKQKWDEAKTWVSNTFNTIHTIASQIWGNIKTVISQYIEGACNNIKIVVANIRDFISAGFSTIKSITSGIWQGIQQIIQTLFQGAYNHVKNIIALIKAIFTGDLAGAKEIVKNIFDNIKNTIKGVMDTARNTVRSAIDKIKSFFNFTWSLPKLKMPHISIKGRFSLSPPSVPKFGIEWYKDGGVMMNPTMFGFNPMSGKAMVGGEAGAEAILPLAKIPELMKEMGYFNSVEGEPIIINIDGREVFRALSPYMGRSVRSW